MTFALGYKVVSSHVLGRLYPSSRIICMLCHMSLTRRDSARSTLPLTIRNGMISEPDIESGPGYSSTTTKRTVKDEPDSSAKKSDPPPFGFPGLAKQIAQDPDQETFVFRKFNRLTAWSLVFQENELASLEDELAHLEDTLLSDPQAMKSAVKWKVFEKKARECESTTEHKIMELTEKITSKLKQYRK